MESASSLTAKFKTRRRRSVEYAGELSWLSEPCRGHDVEPDRKSATELAALHEQQAGRPLSGPLLLPQTEPPRPVQSEPDLQHRRRKHSRALQRLFRVGSGSRHAHLRHRAIDARE